MSAKGGKPAYSLFISRLPGARRVAALCSGRLVRYRVFDDQQGAAAGTLYCGRVTKLTPSIPAAFVDLGDQSGFLNYRDATVPVIDSGQISQVKQLKEGQALLVQLQRQAQGDKLAQLSVESKLVGFHLILLPLETGLHFSRDFRGDRALYEGFIDRLNRELGACPGWLVRSSASETQAEPLLADGRSLWSSWQQVLAGLGSAKPRALYREDPLLRWIIEGRKHGWNSIYCDDETDQANLRAQFQERDPSLSAALKMHDLDAPLFDTYRVEDEIALLEKPQIWLKSGGALVFNRTEAMVTIDVNTARNLRERDQTSSALRTNLEAVSEIVVQIMARDLAGLILIDFVNAREPDWRKRVDKALHEALRADPAKVEALAINKFGVAMLARQREADDAHARFHERCPRCSGRGRIARLEHIVLDVQRQLRRQAPGLEGETLVVRAGSELAEYLEDQRARLIQPLAQRYHLEIEIVRAPMGKRAFEIGM